MIVVDTGPIVALLNDRDDQHERCREFLATHPGPLLVPTTVFTEVCLLAERRGAPAPSWPSSPTSAPACSR